MLLRAAFLGLLGALALLAACGSSKATGSGGECFVAADCVEPLVCVEQKDKTRKCTDNLDSIVGMLPPEAAAPMVDAGPAGETGPETPPDSGGGGNGDQ